MGEAAVLPLIEGLKSSRPNVRHACAAALGNIGPAAEAAVPALIAALSNSEEERMYFVPGAAAKALGQIGAAAASAVPTLIEALRKDETVMQLAVANAVKGIGPEHAIPALIPLLADDKAKWGASHVLKEIGAVVVPAVIPCLAEEKASWGASQVLKEIGAAAVPELIAVLNNGSRLTRHHASTTISIIGSIGSQAISAVPVLIRYLRDDDSFVRCAAAAALDKIQGRAS